MNGEKVLNLGTGERSFTAGQVVQRASDPIFPIAPATPIDFAAQFPQPLDTTELVAMCEELGVWQSLPERQTALKAETWRVERTGVYIGFVLYLVCGRFLP